MRFTTYLGFAMGIAVVYGVVRAKGGDFTIFTNATALTVCLGGTIAAVTLSSARTTILLGLDALRKLFVRRTASGRDVAPQLVALARQAKAGGLASLRVANLTLPHTFLRLGLQLVIDGVEPERIESMLRLESNLRSDKRAAAERLFKMAGTYSPMFGLVGTLIGLIHMLKDLTDPRAIGQGMAVALMATFYGVLLAGLVFLPLAAKIRTLELEERLIRDQITIGLLGIRAGDNPEYVRESVELFSDGVS